MSAERTIERARGINLSPNSRFFQAANTFNLVRTGVELVSELEPRPRDDFRVITEFDSFRSAAGSVIEQHDPTTGELVFVVDLDKTFREQNFLEHIFRLRLGIVRDHELEFGKAVNERDGVLMIVCSQQPRRGFQVARVLSLGGRRYQHIPDCFNNVGIPYLGSKTWGPFYTGFKDKDYAPAEVAEVIEEKCGIDRVGKLVGVGDKFGDVVFVNKVHHHLVTTCGYQGPCDAYWI